MEESRESVVEFAREPAAAWAVIVPYDRRANYPYLDAIGPSRQEALSHFTSFGRFDLSRSEIFRMEFIEATLHHGGAACAESDVTPCVLPVSKGKGEPFVMGVAGSEAECLRILGILGQDPEEYRFVSAGLCFPDGIVI